MKELAGCKGVQMTKDIKAPEDIKKDYDCRLLRKRAQRYRAIARELEEMAQEIESRCGCNTLRLEDKGNGWNF